MLKEWRLWQLVDTAFPAGGFARSGGLEAAWQNGLLDRSPRAAAVANFLRSALRQAARGAAPFVLAAHREPGEFEEIDRRADAFISNHVANTASRAQGRAFLAAAERVFRVAPLSEFSADARRRRSLLHWAPVFGVAAAALELDGDQTTRLFLFLSVRGWVSAAVRLGILGPLEAQSVQSTLADDAERCALIAQQTPLHDAAQTAPLLDLAQGTHDRLYSRLFQS